MSVIELAWVLLNGFADLADGVSIWRGVRFKMAQANSIDGIGPSACRHEQVRVARPWGSSAGSCRRSIRNQRRLVGPLSMPSAAEGGGRRPALRGACQAVILDTRKHVLTGKGGRPRGARLGRKTSRRDLVFGWTSLDPDHEAAMRFGGEAPGRRAHSHLGIEAMPLHGSPPPRTAVNALPQERGRTPKP